MFDRVDLGIQKIGQSHCAERATSSAIPNACLEAISRLPPFRSKPPDRWWLHNGTGDRLARLAMTSKRSIDFCGYRQRHIRADRIFPTESMRCDVAMCFVKAG